MSKEVEIKKFLNNWNKIVIKYQKPDTKKAVIQMLNSILPFLAIWIVMYFSLDWSYWLTLALGIVNAFFMVRIFIIQHDCGHQSFLKSRKWNNVIGFICSFFSSMPYKYWAKSHDFHHAHCGQLEEEIRDIGDIHFLTVEEYKGLSNLKKFFYRLYRNPFVMFLLGPLYYLLVVQRLPLVKLKGWNKIYRNQLINNLAIGFAYFGIAYLLGWKNFLLVHLPIFVSFATIAVWFFYVQHQHDHAYRQWKENWEYLLAAVKGSTFYKLPKVMQWFTGNIGFHHIHHLSSKIPNYNLEKCATENPILQKFATKVTFIESLSYMFNSLWDEQQQKMISFREYRRLKAA